MAQYDVVIVGAGLAGLQTARLLARQGVRVLLVEQKQAVGEQVHTTGIFVRKTLEDFDLPDDCLGPPVRHVVLYSPAGRPLPLESPHVEFRVGLMARLYQRYLDEARAAGTEVLLGTRYVRATTAGGGVTITLAAGDREWQVGARFLIGADGAVSRVAGDLGLDQNREWIVGVEDVLTGVPLEGPPAFHCYLDPRLAPGYLAWVVHDGAEVHLGVAGYAAHYEPVRALGAFRSRMAETWDLSRARLVERRGGRIPVGGVLRRIANPRGLLVGDASGAPSPLTAGGLDPCMRLSALAAHVTAAYLKTGDAAALSAYDGSRFRTRFISRIWMRRLIAAVRQPLLLELGAALLRTPPGRALAWHVFFGRGSFPEVAVPKETAAGLDWG